MVEGLLSVLVQFYYPTYRYFTFPNYQLVPMLEEYAHLLGMPYLTKYLSVDWRRSRDLNATDFSQDGSMGAFEAIFILLVYGLALFPNIDDFVDVNAIRILLIGNPVLTLLGDIYFSLHMRNSKGGGTVACSLDTIDSCGEFSNVPLIGTQEGINYNPTLARHQLGFPLRDKPNNV
ncbi:hypothetical protein KIW84_022936 [Lathyrus oleraceus]|uniref:DUF7745 domain-containing protein n=1 Tax=Pisum sativum TaxID=3888 RepID=A0A9D4YFJ9_PEA|nr:hypothetical protein KIW84_022936 [Pisum sativum]